MNSDKVTTNVPAKIRAVYCGGCRYWKRDEVNRRKGACSAPLPTSLFGFFIRLTDTDEAAGQDCPTFRKRIVRQRKIVGIAASIHALDASRHGHD